MQNFEAGLIFRRRIYRSAYWSRYKFFPAIWRNDITQAARWMSFGPVAGCEENYVTGGAPLDLNRSIVWPFPRTSFSSPWALAGCGKLRKKPRDHFSEIAPPLQDLTIWIREVRPHGVHSSRYCVQEWDRRFNEHLITSRFVGRTGVLAYVSLKK